MLRRGLALLACSAVLVCVVAAAAGATTLQVSPRDVRITWSELKFRGGFGESTMIETSCAVSFGAEFRSGTFAKAVEPVAATMYTPSIVYVCRGQGEPIIYLQSWPLRFASFSGTLPSVSGVSFTSTGFSVTVAMGGLFECRYSFNRSAGLLRLGVSGGTIAEARFDESLPMLLASGGFLCPAEMTVSGTATRVVGSEREARAIALTLV